MKSSILLFVLAVAGCAAESSPDESAVEADVLSTPAGTLWSDGGFGGSAFAITAPRNGAEIEGNLPADFDNIASSLTVRAKCTIELFTGPDSSGLSSGGYVGNVNQLPPGIDNEVSSYRAFCIPTCTTGKHWCGPDQGCTTQLCM